MYPRLDLKTDLFDPQYATFYGPPQKPGTPESQAWMDNWVARNEELIDKYKPDLLYFDNGVNPRRLDSAKLKVAAHYYNRAVDWGKQVSISTKDSAYLGGSILDFEKSIRGPKDILPDVFQIDDVISDRSWGYTSEMKYRSTASIISELVDTVSKNGNLMLNISPMADGTIPEPQQKILLEIGKWLETNGEAIYGTRPWYRFGEGNFRFTTKGNTLYAIALSWPGGQAVIAALAKDHIEGVSLLGHSGALEYSQDSDGLKIKLPAEKPGNHAFAFKIRGPGHQPMFDFGADAKVSANTIYAPERGYGFDLGSKITCGPASCTSDHPFFFSVRLPEGNYTIKLKLGDPEAESVTTVKAESRRLVLEKVTTARGQFAMRTFTVNVRNPWIATNGEVKLKDREIGGLHWDDKLTLEFNGSRPSVSALEITKVDDAITVYIMGDSTVTDQTKEPWNSWGQMLPRFFKAGVAIANHAESGESLKSSLNARRLDKVMSAIKPGGYLFIQFGHNDQKERGEGVGAFTTYKSDLKHYVAEARLRGAIPVLITPVNRRTFDTTGTITNSLGDYPDAVRQTAAEERVPLIDLNAMSKLFYEALGPEESKKAFVDNTHHNNYGSYELAKCIVEGIKAAKLDIVKFLVTDVPKFDPAHPDAIDKFSIPDGT